MFYLEDISVIFKRYKKQNRLRVQLTGQQKRATCLAILLQNELSSDVARFTTHESDLSWNKSGCCRLRKVFAECVYVARFTGPKQTCFAGSDVNPVYGVTPAYPNRRQFSYSRNLQQPDFLQDRFERGW